MAPQKVLGLGQHQVRKRRGVVGEEKLEKHKGGLKKHISGGGGEDSLCSLKRISLWDE